MLLRRHRVLRARRADGARAGECREGRGLFPRCFPPVEEALTLLLGSPIHRAGRPLSPASRFPVVVADQDDVGEAVRSEAPIDVGGECHEGVLPDTQGRVVRRVPGRFIDAALEDELHDWRNQGGSPQR